VQSSVSRSSPRAAGRCGFFLYIGASDLLPESHHRHPKALTGLTNILGAALIWIAVHFAAF
jgi:hypothetical protein